MKKIAVLLLLITFSAMAFSSKLVKYSIRSNGIERVFYLYTPLVSKPRLPVLLAFHGGGGTALNAEKQYGFSALADKYGYLVVYPQGMNKQWNDGRVAPAKGEAYDDVRFVKDILTRLPALAPKADTSTVFSTGISNGGFFSIYLAYKLNNVIDAIAPVCASIPRDLENSFSLRRPVPMLLIAGTADPLVKYKGGWVGFRNQDKGRGYSMPVEWTVNKWISLTGCYNKAVAETIPDEDRFDDCTAIKYTYQKEGKPFLIFVKIENGGHAWPGGTQYLPPMLIGKLCNDFSASEMIIRFFNSVRNERMN